jgi:hypothetical protein
MLFASNAFGEGVFMTILFVGAGVWAFSHVLGKIDKGGKIKKAATDETADWIRRLFKK